MKIVYSHEDIPTEGTSIFLAGPTPRSLNIESWRPNALELLGLENAKPDIVFVPEDRDTMLNEIDFDHSEQVAWERKALEQSDVVVFWIPRELNHMPGFTTNIEFGFVSERDQKFVLGYPKDAPKMKYLAWVANEKGMPVVHSLQETLKSSIIMLKKDI